jgi:hypothetical protein
MTILQAKLIHCLKNITFLHSFLQILVCSNAITKVVLNISRVALSPLQMQTNLFQNALGKKLYNKLNQGLFYRYGVQLVKLYYLNIKFCSLVNFKKK